MSDGFWRGRPVLVTGATGLLGGWLVASLLARGAEVTAIVRRPRPRSQFELAGLRPRVRVVEGAAEDPAAVAAAFAAPVSVAFHLASLVDVPAAFREPAAALRSSIDTTLALLEHVRLRSPATIVVVASSDKAYGAGPVPYREDRPLQPLHPYEIGKAAQDLLAQSYGKLYGVRTGILRPGNYFGGWDFAFERIIPYTIRQALHGAPPVLRSDGSHVRDFLYVEEAVAANLLLAERLAADPALAGEAFNVSHEVAMPVLDLVRTILRLMGSDLEPEIAGQAKAEIAEQRLDSGKARRVLGWRPALDFDAGLARTIDWYRANRALWEG